MPATGADSTEVSKILPIDALKVSMVVQVPVNIFTGTLQDNLCFTSNQVHVLVDDGYDIQESVLYWKISYIKEWYQIKTRIPESRGGISYGDRKINFAQAHRIGG